MTSTTLHEAVTNGNKEKILDILQEITTVGDLKSTDDDGSTLLHLTFKNTEITEPQLIEILEIFLDRGIDIKSENKFGKTILHLAVEYRMRDVIDLCLRRNAVVSPNPPDRSDTIAHFAIEEECRKFHSYIDDDTIDNIKPLERESSAFIQWMVSRGIDFFRAKNTHSYTAFRLANALNLQHIVLALLKRVDEYSQIDAVGRMPFLTAYVLSSAAPDQYDTICHKIVKPIPKYHYRNHYTHVIVKLILEKNRFIDDQKLTNDLTWAIMFDHDRRVIQMLLRRLNYVRDTGIRGLMHQFAMKFHDLADPSTELSTLKTLIRKGADVDGRNYYGDTHAQSMFRAHPSLELLKILKSSTSFRMRAENGQNFLHIIAELTDEPEMVDIVVNRGCSLEDTDGDGLTPLKIALFGGHDLVATRLLELGAKYRDVTAAGRTLLSIACQSGNPRAAEKLLGYGGFDLEWRSKEGMTLLHIAREHPKVVELLVKSGLDVNSRDMQGKTPMHRAIKGPVVRTLFQSGGRVDELDDRGISPLVNALISYGGYEVVVELLRCGADMREPKALETALRGFHSPANIENLRCMRRHLLKLSAAELLDQELLKGKGMKFLEECRLEVDALKAFRIDDGTSLYKLLHKNPNRRCSYADNAKLKNFVEDAEMEKKFPNYFVLIAGCYNDAVTRKPLLQAGVKALNEFTGVVWPYLCADKILAWLGNEDLRFFVEALGNFNPKI